MEHIVEKEQMDALRALSDTNLKISEAKAALLKLKETEVEYLESRERQTSERIQKVLNESKEVIEETKRNYSEAQEFHTAVSSFADFLIKAQETFELLLQNFKEKSDLWEKEISRQEKDIEESRKRLVIENAKIEDNKKSIETAKRKILHDQIKIDDERQTLKRAIERLKNNKI